MGQHPVNTHWPCPTGGKMTGPEGRRIRMVVRKGYILNGVVIDMI